MTTALILNRIEINEFRLISRLSCNTLFMASEPKAWMNKDFKFRNKASSPDKDGNDGQNCSHPGKFGLYASAESADGPADSITDQNHQQRAVKSDGIRDDTI